MAARPFIAALAGALAVAVGGFLLAASLGGAIEIEPAYAYDDWGTTFAIEPRLLADDLATAEAQLEAKLPSDFAGREELLAILAQVDFEESFIVEGAIALCSPPVAVEPRLVIDDQTWAVDHSTRIDDDVDCDAANQNWFLFVVDRVHRPLFE